MGIESASIIVVFVPVNVELIRTVHYHNDADVHEGTFILYRCLYHGDVVIVI